MYYTIGRTSIDTFCYQTLFYMILAAIKFPQNQFSFLLSLGMDELQYKT